MAESCSVVSDNLGDVQGQKVIHPMEGGLASGVKHPVFPLFFFLFVLVAYYLLLIF